jgi:hypothetical protein
MKRLLEFKAFESLSELTGVQKRWLNRVVNGSWYIGTGGMVDIEGDFSSKSTFSDFKGIEFGIVSGNFSCYNKSLNSLKGSPREVGRDFDCGYNHLVTLEGGPKMVGEDFACNNNQLKTLKGAPEWVGGVFFCEENRLENLNGSPRTVRGGFYCEDNNLITLEGAPEKIGGEFRSDLITIPAGKWGLSSWLNVLEEGDSEARKLIVTLITPEALNKRLKESPERTMIALKGVWNSPGFAKTRSQLRIPKDYEDEMDLMGDLDDIGL